MTKREPSAAELAHATGSFATTAELEEYVRTSVADYVGEGSDRTTYEYDRATDVVTARHIRPKTYEGVLMSNGFIGFVTSPAPYGSERVYVKDGELNLECIDVTGVELRKSVSLVSHPLRRVNHVQQLHLAECRFSDVFALEDVETNGTIQVQIDRYPLHTVRSCLAQRIRVSADYDVFLDLVHIIRNTRTFDQFVLHLNNDTLKGDIYEATNAKTVATTLTHFVTPFMHKQPKRLAHGGFEDLFEFHVTAGADPIDIYVVTSLNKAGTSTTNQNIIRNLFYNSGDGANVVAAHVELWRGSFWNTTMDVVSKTAATPAEKAETALMVGGIRRAVFAMYSDISTSISTDILLFGMPVLIYLKPTVARELLEVLIERLDPTNMYQVMDRFSTYDYVMQNMSRDTYFIYSTAMLAVHIWNLFRVTVDRNWLINTGYPAMRRSCDFLITQKRTHNTVVDYMVSTAYRFMHQTMYELNYVQIGRYPTDAYVFATVEHTQDVTNAGTTFYVRVEREDESELWHFAFYDSEDRYLGYKFGGTSGYRLMLQADTAYTFRMMFNLSEFPILFFKPVPEEFVIAITTDDTFYHSTVMHHTMSAAGVLVANSNELVSFGLHAASNSYNTFRKKFDTSYGTNAFATHTLNNVLLPHTGYAGESVEVAEPYVLLNSYYNTGFFLNKSPLDNAHKIPFVDIVRDTTTYFEQVMEDTEFNLLSQAGLENMASQYASHYTTKRAMNVRSHYHLARATRRRLFDTGNWLYDGAISTQLLFTLLTGVLELTILGEIRKDRIMVVDYGVSAMVKHALPEQWSSVTLTGAGVANKTYRVHNMLLVEPPFDRLIDGLVTTSRVALETSTVDVALDFSRVFPQESSAAAEGGAAPDDFDYRVYLQATDDDTDYSDPEHRASVLERPDLLHKPSLIQIPFTNAVPETVESATEVALDPALVRKRTLHLIYNVDETAPSFAMTTRVIDVPDTVAPPGNGTLNIGIAYEQYGVVVLHMAFNSLVNATYQPFDALNVMLSYDSMYFDSSHISYEHDSPSAIFSLDTATSTMMIDVAADAPMVSPSFSVGALKMRLTSGGMAALSWKKISDLVNGVVMNGFDMKAIHFTNPELFPPPVATLVATESFAAAPRVLRALYTEDALNGRWYHVVSGVSVCTGPTALTSPADDNQFVTVASAGEALVGLTGGGEHAILAYHSAATLQTTYRSVGTNAYGQGLATTGGGSTTTPVLCDQFGAVVPAAVYSTTGSTIVLSDTGKLFGVGYNESYNLGTGNNTSPTSLTECVLLNALAASLGLAVRTVSMNDKATLVVFGERTVYALGESVALGDDVRNTPAPMTELNSFLASGGYAVERIDTGLDHFKFLLKRTAAATGTEETEWWGLGRNAARSMGVDERLGSSVVVRGAPKRLHLLERFIAAHERYHLVRSNGAPSTLTVMVDRGTGRMYALGSFGGQEDPSEEGGEGEQVFTRWTEVLVSETDEATRSTARFYSMRAGPGFLIGLLGDTDDGGVANMRKL